MPRAHAQCADHPTTLAAMRDCYRVLLISGGEADTGAIREQFEQLRADPEGLRERDLRIVLIDAAIHIAQPSRALPIAALSPAELRAIRQRFHLHERFTVILVGKDGGEKLRQEHPMTLDRLFRTIDSMPMRRREMREHR